MGAQADVLERSVLPAGKVFIKAGEENSRAYIVQAGKVLCFTMKGEEKVEVARFGPGAMIGETCLLLDDPIPLNYESLTSTTVVTITRQDFQKRMARIDKGVRNILDRAMQKLQDLEKEEMDKALRLYDVSPKTLEMVKAIVRAVPADLQGIYEAELLPHIDGLSRIMEEIKEINKTKKGQAEESKEGVSGQGDQAEEEPKEEES
jgi:CRP-like cAMP-binding protein